MHYNKYNTLKKPTYYILKKFINDFIYNINIATYLIQISNK